MTELVHQFRVLAENFCHLIESEGLLVRPYQLASMPFFQALNEDEQSLAIVHLQNYLEICRSTIAEGSSLRDERALVAKALEHFQLDMDSRVFQGGSGSMVYEFYALSQTQYFRTVNFFEFTSYTIEDLYSRSWFNLYSRDDDITRKLLGFAHQIVTGQQQTPIAPDIPEHFMIERASLEKLKVPTKHVCLAPLMQDQNIVGIVSVIKCSGNFISAVD